MIEVFVIALGVITIFTLALFGMRHDSGNSVIAKASMGVIFVTVVVGALAASWPLLLMIGVVDFLQGLLTS